MNNTFQEDLKRGIAVEEKALALIKPKYPSASLINAFKGYDIWIPEMIFGHLRTSTNYDKTEKKIVGGKKLLWLAERTVAKGTSKSNQKPLSKARNISTWMESCNTTADTILSVW